MFIIKLLSQHVSGIIMPIIRRKRVFTAAYGVLHWWLCGAGTRPVCTVKVTVTFTVNTARLFIIKLLSQLVSGIIMPIIRRTRVFTAAYGVLHW